VRRDRQRREARVADLEATIASLEGRRDALERDLEAAWAADGGGPEEAARLGAELERVRADLAASYEAWTAAAAALEAEGPAST
jgi:hypothetical protein